MVAARAETETACRSTAHVPRPQTLLTATPPRVGSPTPRLLARRAKDPSRLGIVSHGLPPVWDAVLAFWLLLAAIAVTLALVLGIWNLIEAF